MKIAVSGKGGVGKTLVAGVLANFFAKKGFKVLAIDADPSPNLGLTLGLSLEEIEEIVPISENTKLLEAKTRTNFEGVYRLTFRVDDLVEKFALKTPLGIHLLIMGSVKSVGAGCTCPSNAVIRELIRHLFVERDEFVIVDMEAGVEHMGRGTAKHVDVMLIVTNPGMKSIGISRKIHGLAIEAGIENAFIIGNKIRNKNEGRLIQQFAEDKKLPVLGLIPQDEMILKADMQGETPVKYGENSVAIATIHKIGEKLLESDS